MRAAAALLLTLACAQPVAAQERAPPERQTLLDLSYTLGEAHALRQVCEGAEDQFWRQRMVRLIEVEQAEERFDTQLRERFNAGFAFGQAQHPACNPETRRAEATTAARGQGLATKLTAAVSPATPAAPAPAPPP